MLKLIIAFLVSMPYMVFAQPKITDLSKYKFYTATNNKTPELRIGGYNLSTDMRGYNTWVKVFFKKGDRKQEIRRIITENRMIVVPMTSDWLYNTLPIEVIVETAGLRSNPMIVEVIEMPDLPPVINFMRPLEYTIGQVADYHIEIWGINFGDIGSTYITVNGIIAETRGVNYDLSAGRMDVWIPKELINTPGTHLVHVVSNYGTSNSMPLNIVKPVIKEIIRTDSMNMKKDSLELTSLYGIKIVMKGMVNHSEEKSILKNYAKELDRVYSINNQLTESNAGVIITLTSKNLERVTLEHAKLSLEKKLIALQIKGTVVIE